MRLDSNKEDFLDLIRKTSKQLNIAFDYVEKDYWLYLILKEIFKNNEKGYVFKGGTSLSKCHHLVNRFSEDIDISYSSNYKELTGGQARRQFNGVFNAIKRVGLEIENLDNLRARRYFNQFRCPYESLFDETAIEKVIKIELAAQTPSFPSEEKELSCFIGNYLELTERYDLIKQYELEPFVLQVQSLSRTLVDKTFAICDYFLDKKCNRHSRHIYDISKLLTEIKLDESLADLFKQVREYRKEITICKSAKEGIKLYDLMNKILTEQSYKKDYESITMTLLYEEYPYRICEQSLIELTNFLKSYDL